MSTSPGAANPTWQARYEELLQWRAEHGDTCVPKAEGALGRWVARQRELKRSGKLDPGREQALNNIGFVWNTVTAMWEERYLRLTEWKQVHGHCAVPIAQGELGTWVSKQRQLRKRGKLSQEKIEALNNLGFTWSTAEADWEDKFKRLCQWAKERGHASVPFNEGELGWWVNTQRQCKRKGKLSMAREERLCSLGFVWNPSSSRSKNSEARNQQRQNLLLQQHVSHVQSQAQSSQQGDSMFMSLVSPQLPPPMPPASSGDSTPRTTPERYDDPMGLPAEHMDPLNLLTVESKSDQVHIQHPFNVQATAAAAAAAASAAAHAQALASFGPQASALGLHPLQAGDDLTSAAYGFVSGGVGLSDDVGLGVTETSPQPQAEGPFSPMPVSLGGGRDGHDGSLDVWSPIELSASPIVPTNLLNPQLPMYGTASTIPLQLQPSVQHVPVPFSQAMSVQTHSEALEQLLSKPEPSTDHHDPCG